MNLTESTLKFLAKTICGDNGLMPRKKGPDLMEFFYEYGDSDRKKGDFTNRLKFAESKLKLLNNTPQLASIIESSLDLREFFASKINREDSIRVINVELLKDGYEIREINDHYKVVFQKDVAIQTKNTLSHEFIAEKINSCHKQIENGELYNAMELAKSLLTSVMRAVIEEKENPEIKENFEELYKKVRNKLKFNETDPSLSSFSIVQILSGFTSIIEGLSPISKHLKKDFAPTSLKISWVRLMVNSSKALSEFFLDHHVNLRQ